MVSRPVGMLLISRMSLERVLRFSDADADGFDSRLYEDLAFCLNGRITEIGSRSFENITRADHHRIVGPAGGGIELATRNYPGSLPTLRPLATLPICLPRVSTKEDSSDITDF